jgi:hypothetical protein
MLKLSPRMPHVNAVTLKYKNMTPEVQVCPVLDQRSILPERKLHLVKDCLQFLQNFAVSILPMSATV